MFPTKVTDEFLENITKNNSVNNNNNNNGNNTTNNSILGENNNELSDKDKLKPNKLKDKVKLKKTIALSKDETKVFKESRKLFCKSLTSEQLKEFKYIMNIVQDEQNGGVKDCYILVHDINFIIA